jgi:hypothetical protein
MQSKYSGILPPERLKLSFLSAGKAGQSVPIDLAWRTFEEKESVVSDHLAKIRQLKSDVADEWDLDKFSERLYALIDGLIEAEAFLLTTTPSQRTAVLSHTVKCEVTFVLQGYSLLLHRKGLLDVFFSKNPDPLFLSGAVQRLMNQIDDPEHMSLARESIRLGAIFIPEKTGYLAEILHTKDGRLPVDVCKGLLQNYLEYSWAYDIGRLNNGGARDFTIALLTVCADDGEEDFVIDFLAQAHENLLPDRSLNNEGRATPTHAYYELLLQHCRHEQLMVRLSESSPELYQALMVDKGYQKALHKKITEPAPGDVFDISRLPPSSVMDEEFLSHALCSLSTSGKLNVARYVVIARTWVKAGFPGSVQAYAKGFEPLRQQLAELQAYRSTIFTESTLEQLWGLSKRHATFHQSLLMLDFIYTAQANQILNDVETLDRHHAMHVLKHDEIPDTLKVDGTVMVSPLLLAACLKRVRHMSDYDEKNADIEAVITDAFSNSSLHGTLRKLSEKRLYQVRRYAPGITDEVIRTIHWDDLKIMASMFSEDLGI